MDSASLFPCASREELVRQYVGKSLHDAPSPAAVLDISKLKKNCDGMLEAVKSLNCGWRAHIKTHKVPELFEFLPNITFFSSRIVVLFS